MLGFSTADLPVRSTTPELSVIVPVRNEAGNINAILERLDRTLAGTSFEVVFTDDGSTDDSLNVLRSAAARDARVKVISFSRNFGHQVAVTAALEQSTGKAVVIIDADLQDPPEVIPAMVARWKEGFDIVYGQRSARVGDSWMKRVTAGGFYQLLSRMTEFRLPVDTGDFRLVSRRAVEAFLAMPEHHRFVRGMFAWVGFRQTAIHYDRAPRHSGRTNYNYARMLRLALDGITAFSRFPLRLASYLGFAAAAIGFVLILYALYSKFFGVNTMKGWASLSIIVLFMGGTQLLVIGLLGEYIGRMQDEVKKRPLYIVQETINLPGGKAQAGA